MEHDIKLVSGRIVRKKSDAARQEQEGQRIEAVDEAGRILAEAHAQAAEIISEARARATREELRIREIADDELTRFMDTEAIDQAANAVKTALSGGMKLRADFDAFTPWVEDFVRAALVRITGAMVPEDLWHGLIAQAMMDVRDRWNLVLECHPERVTLIQKVIAEDPSLHDCIKAVRGVRSFDLDDCLIKSAGGVIDISVPTQIVTLLYALEKVTEETPQTGDSA